MVGPERGRFHHRSPSRGWELHHHRTELQPPRSHPAEIAAGYTNNDDFEFIELQNTGSETIDLSVPKSRGAFRLPSVHRRSILGEYVMVVENQAAFESRFGTSLNVAGEYSGKLSNGSEQLTLRDTFGGDILVFQYEDGDGWPERRWRRLSLEIVDPGGDYEDPLNWRASSDFGGSPEPSASGRSTTSSSMKCSPTATGQASMGRVLQYFWRIHRSRRLVPQ